ncbi:polysaccharide deacetylase family protein [Paenibacillus sp. FSL H8-0034]|uniref:polysaccharide deacetylase family protein n=1 Tax=Paenibacillus sp. FSL H8-0034 TaxID=2954671 RepID=UPI0030FBEE10
MMKEICRISINGTERGDRLMISLAYHDVVAVGKEDSSGFLGREAGAYKLSKEQFQMHLEQISQLDRVKVRTVVEALQKPSEAGDTVTLTFDDGGISAYSIIADLLEAKGWKGHFLITTAQIGANGFVSKEQIRSLDARGHIIGTHSCTHPSRFNECSWEQQVHEWKVSVQTLSDVLGKKVTTASIPGDTYNLQLAEAAAHAGIQYLFTSEPKVVTSRVNGCLIVGRYLMKKTTSPETAAAIAAGDPALRLRCAIQWKLRKAAMAMAGNRLLDMRKKVVGNNSVRY